MENSIRNIGVLKFGVTISIITAIITTVTFGIAICTPPLSGPFCSGDCLEYPYTDIISRFPRDYYWMIPAILASFSYMILMVLIHTAAPDGKKVYSLAGLCFAIISTLILSVDYFIQLSFIHPSLMSGETEGIAVLSQYNPHGIFIILEELGFITMNISLFSIIPVFRNTTKPGNWLSVTFFSGFILMCLSFLAIIISFGSGREYRFEVIIISITWIELIAGSVMLACYFTRLTKQIQA